MNRFVLRPFLGLIRPYPAFTLKLWPVWKYDSPPWKRSWLRPELGEANFWPSTFSHGITLVLVK